MLATLFLREPITWLKAGGVLLGCGGALLLILVSRHGTGGTSSVAGDVLCVISAVSYATYLTAFRNVIVKYSPVTTMKWMFLFAAVAAVAIYYRPLARVDYAALAPRTWAGIGYVVVCSTFLSYFMVPIGQRYLRPTVVSMYNYVQPLVAVLFTVAVGLDTFGFTKGVGRPVRLRRGMAGYQVEIAGTTGCGEGRGGTGSGKSAPGIKNRLPKILNY